MCLYSLSICKIKIVEDEIQEQSCQVYGLYPVERALESSKWDAFWFRHWIEWFFCLFGLFLYWIYRKYALPNGAWSQTKSILVYGG